MEEWAGSGGVRVWRKKGFGRRGRDGWSLWLGFWRVKIEMENPCENELPVRREHFQSGRPVVGYDYGDRSYKRAGTMLVFIGWDF